MNITNYASELSQPKKVIELKKILKELKLPLCGKKKELHQRIYLYYYKLNCVHRIQNLFYQYMYRKLKRIRGNRMVCNNKDDFLTGDDLITIPQQYIFTITDNEFTYGFHIESFARLISSTRPEKDPLNPYTRNIILPIFIQNMKDIFRISKILGKPIQPIEKEPEYTLAQQVVNRTVILFQNINYLGHYTDYTWFLHLSRIKILKFVRELIDIWNYRAALTEADKKSICPPYGRPFSNYDYNDILLSKENLQMHALSVMENLISAPANETKTIGSYYILGALSLVSQDAGNAMPLILDSFI